MMSDDNNFTCEAKVGQILRKRSRALYPKKEQLGHERMTQQQWSLRSIQPSIQSLSRSCVSTHTLTPTPVPKLKIIEGNMNKFSDDYKVSKIGCQNLQEDCCQISLRTVLQSTPTTRYNAEQFETTNNNSLVCLLNQIN